MPTYNFSHVRPPNHTLPDGDYISAHEWSRFGEYAQKWTKSGGYWSTVGAPHTIASRIPDDLVAVEDLTIKKRQSMLRFLVEGHGMTPEQAAHTLDRMGHL